MTSTTYKSLSDANSDIGVTLKKTLGVFRLLFANKGCVTHQHMNDDDLKDKDVSYIFGMPSRWQLNNLFLDIWNPNDPRILPPKHFGIGWGLNVHAILKKLDVIE